VVTFEGGLNRVGSGIQQRQVSYSNLFNRDAPGFGLLQMASRSVSDNAGELGNVISLHADAVDIALADLSAFSEA
jgi:hypothetical protein